MDMMSAFDPSTFLTAQQTEVNERRQPLPIENPHSEDKLYTGMIGEIKTESGTIGKGDRTGQPWVSVMIPVKIDVPPQLRDALKLPETLTFTDRVFLDLTPQNTVDNSPGKNRGQKHYRDIFDLNKPGEPFAWTMIQGRPVKIKIGHRLVQPEGGLESYIVDELGGVYRAR